MRLTLLAPLLLLLAAAPAPPPAHPALWKLSDADTTIWLFGSIHALPPGFRWRDRAIDAALDTSDGLTLETVIDREPEKIAAFLFSTGSDSGLPPLSERVPADKRARLAALIAKSGIPAKMFERMKDWAAAAVLTGTAMNEIGVGADNGVERELTTLFRTRNAPVDGFETPEQQLGFFDALPANAQRKFLISTLDSPAKAKKEFDAIIAAWRKGDVAAIARAFADDPEFTPELRELLVHRRNVAWADALQQRLARPGTRFVAVGAGHLAGPDSLIAMLKAKGLRVKRAD